MFGKLSIKIVTKSFSRFAYVQVNFGIFSAIIAFVLIVESLVFGVKWNVHVRSYIWNILWHRFNIIRTLDELVKIKFPYIVLLNGTERNA